MLTKLTKEMEELMFRVRDEWINLVFSGKDLKEDEIEDEIKWLYKKIGLDKPDIFILDSYLEQKRKISDFVENSVGEEVGRQVWKRVEKPIREQVEEEVRREVWWQVEKEVKRKVEEEVWWQVEEQVWEQLWRPVKEQLEKQGLSFIEQDFGLGPEPGWMSYGDYFQRLGVVKNEDFLKYVGMYKKGVWDVVYFDKAVFIAKLPLKIIRDEEGRLHSVSEPAVQWRDGNCNYFLHGVGFEEELWREITRGKMSVKEILSIKDREKRYAALVTYGQKRLLEELK